mgnify:CR=1 FL=1
MFGALQTYILCNRKYLHSWEEAPLWGVINLTVAASAHVGLPVDIHYTANVVPEELSDISFLISRDQDCGARLVWTSRRNRIRIRLSRTKNTQISIRLKESDPDPTDKTNRFGMVDFRALKPVEKPVTLADIKATLELQNMALVRQSRLSVCPVTATEWRLILKMSGTKA